MISRETTANDIEEWDSLSPVNLIVAVEARFKVKFALRELQTLKNVGELIDSPSLAALALRMRAARQEMSANP